MRTVVLDPDQMATRTKTVVSQSRLANQLGSRPEQVTSSTEVAGSEEEPAFKTEAERKVARAVYKAIRKLESQPERVPTSRYLNHEEIQKKFIEDLEAEYKVGQMELA